VGTAEQGERAAAAALDARTRLEEQGLATTLELMQAQTAQVQARLNLINAHIALRVARVQLDHALGRE
jgi:outer membrane protein TolC